MNTSTASRKAGRAVSKTLRVIAAGLVTMAIVGLTSLASAQTIDWSATDVKKRVVKTSDYRGKVLLVFITSDKTRDMMQPITKRLAVEFGHNPDVGQLTLADFSDAPFTWKAAEKAADEVTDRTAAAHDRTVKRIQTHLKKKGKKPIPGLGKKLHIILDWEAKLTSKYKPWDTEKLITVAVMNQQGDMVGKWKVGPGTGKVETQLKPVMEAVEATLE